MKKQKKRYENVDFLFICRKCSKKRYEKTAFMFEKFSRSNFVILRCKRCGALISRRIKIIEESIMLPKIAEKPYIERC
jgi:hypothetical protein